MEKILYPQKSDWSKLVLRPETQKADLDEMVARIFTEVKLNGDKSVAAYTQLFDGAEIKNSRISEEVIRNASEKVSAELKNAIQLAKNNIEKFHAVQIEKPVTIETMPGVYCRRESRPIEKIGLYIPGGSAPLFSTVLMLGIPAKIAGCKEIILCTPPDKNGNIHPAILYTAALVGITAVYSIGGVQAIAAMALGTETIPKADKIFGPGNQYVTAAKQYAQNSGIAIDMPAGPSEVLVIADHTCVPAFVAADLLSQAEHGADSQVMLLSDSEEIIDDVLSAIEEQITALPRKDIAENALQKSKAILLSNLEEAIAFSNNYAPEHLILATENPEVLTEKITNAGSVFLGNYSCESAGDYASGTNHTLPTNGYARSYSGVSTDSFVKKITFQRLTAAGLKNIGPAIEIMAEAEQLIAHKNAVTIRLKNLENV